MANLFFKSAITVTSVVALSEQANTKPSTGTGVNGLKLKAPVIQFPKWKLRHAIPIPTRRTIFGRPHFSLFPKVTRTSQANSDTTGSNPPSMDSSLHDEHDANEDAVKVSIKGKAHIEIMKQAVTDWTTSENFDDMRRVLYEYKKQKRRCIFKHESQCIPEETQRLVRTGRKTKSKLSLKKIEEHELDNGNTKTVYEQTEDGQEKEYEETNIVTEYKYNALHSYVAKEAKHFKIEVTNDQIEKALKELEDLKTKLHTAATTILKELGASEEKIRALEKKLKKNDYYLFPQFARTSSSSVPKNDDKIVVGEFSEYYFSKQEGGPQYKPEIMAEGMYFFTNEELIANIIYDIEMSLDENVRYAKNVQALFSETVGPEHIKYIIPESFNRESGVIELRLKDSVREALNQILERTIHIREALDSSNQQGRKTINLGVVRPVEDHLKFGEKSEGFNYTLENLDEFLKLLDASVSYEKKFGTHLQDDEELQNSRDTILAARQCWRLNENDRLRI